MARKKKLSDKSRRWFQEFLDHYYELDSDREEVAGELRKRNKRALELMSYVKPWGQLYQHTPAEIIFVFFWMIGMRQKIIDLADSERTIDDYQKLFGEMWNGKYDDQLDDVFEKMNDDERGLLLAVLFTMLGNMDGLKFYSASVSDLVKIADVGEGRVARKALMEAVVVDRSVVCNSVIAKRISMAQIARDEGFMNELAKAITRTRPRRKHNLDDFRFMAEVIEEAEGLDTYSFEELTEMFANTLGVIPPDSTADAVKKNLQKRKDRKRGSEKAV